MANGVVLCYPEGNATWEAYIAANARTPTESEITATQKYFPDVTATAVFTNGVWFLQNSNKARAVACDPWAVRDWFVIKGSSGPVSTGSNVVKPEYGIRARSELDASVTCTAPTTKQTYEGNDYVFKGYVVEKYAGNGTWTKVAEGEGNSYTFANSTIGSGSYRLVWQWQLDARYQLNWHSDLIPEGGVTVTVDKEPDEEGYYQSGTVVTLTAADGSNADWGAFGAWTGDVGNDRRWTDSRSISITMDGHKSIYCGQAWSFTGSALYDGVHTVKASASGKSISISADATQYVTPVFPALDLRKKIAGGYTLTAINSYGTRSSQFTELYLPDTLASLGSEQNMSAFTYVYPFIPSSVATLGARGLQNVGYAEEVRFMNENLAEFPEQVIFGTSIKNIILGKGFTLIGQHFFQHLGGDAARTVKFVGGCPQVRAWNNSCNESVLRLFVDPVNNASWADYIASSAREATDAEKTAYVTKFGDDGTVPSYVTTNAMPRYESDSGVWGNKQYLVLWNPNTDDTGLFIAGSPRNCAADVKPYYGRHFDYAIGEAVTCTAPLTTKDDDGADVTCTGYVIEKANADGTWFEVAKGDGTNVVFTQTKGYHRVVWQWTIDARYAIDYHADLIPEGGVTVTADPAPDAQGLYQAGTVVTLTAADGANADWGAFGAWVGDVGNDRRWTDSRSIAITVDGPKSVYCEQVWSYADSKLTDGSHTLGVTASDKNISLKMDGATMTPVYPVLDLRKKIAGGYTLTGIADYGTRNSTFTQLFLPDTLNSIGENQSMGTYTYVYPYIPYNVASLGSRALQGVQYNGEARFMNDSLTYFPEQVLYESVVRNVILGKGFTLIGQHFFQHLGGDAARTVKFLGGCPQVRWSNNSCSESVLRLFVDPVNNLSWSNYVATSAREATADEIKAYTKKFGDDGTVPSYVTTNAMPRYESDSGVWGNKQYLVLWNPNTDDTGLFIAGSPKNYTASVSPYYGGHYDYAIGETVTCTAPATTQDDDGSEVTCNGYVVEQANADGTWSEVSRGDGTSVSFTQTKGYHRVVWQWKKGAVEVKIGAVPYPETDSVTISPVQAKYYPGDTITVTAVGDAFYRWYGDVPVGHEYDRSFTVTLEDAVSFNPYFAHPWAAVEGYETSRMTDGYWTLKISQTSDGEVSIPIDCMKASEIQQPTTNLVTVLDLRKPISGGRTLVAVNDYAFRYDNNNTTQVQFRQLRLAETVRSIGYSAFSGHPFEDIEGCLPAALTSLGGKAFAETCTYDGTLALTNKAFTTFPSQLFSMGGRVSKIILGTGVTKICSYAFDNQKGDFDIYFNGNVPKFESTGWFRGVSDQRLFVPSERWGLHADWTDFIATNCTAITDAQLTSYATKYGEEAPKPVAKFSGQYVVLFESPYDKPRKFTVILR